MATLSRKYRPKRWSDVAGQSHIVTTLTNALKGNLVAQAYLFTGPRGTGKTTVARLLAASINCANRQRGQEPCGACAHCRAFEENRALDIIEIDGASNNGIDNIRELRETVKLPPTLGIKKIYIIDEAHMLTGPSWNALLKTLEEPPSHVVFILATTELHKIPETISSRCQRFDFSRFPTDTLVEKLSRIAREEGVAVDADALEMIALAAEGGMRDAESLLAQAISLEDSHITGKEAAAILGISEQKTVLDYLDALGAKDLDAAILSLGSLVEKGADMRSFATALSHMLRELLFRKLGKKAKDALVSRASKEERETLERLAARFTFPKLARLMELVQEARKEIRHASLEHIPLEIATLAFLFPESPAHDIQTVSPEGTAPPHPPLPHHPPLRPLPTVQKRASAPKPMPTTSNKEEENLDARAGLKPALQIPADQTSSMRIPKNSEPSESEQSRKDSVKAKEPPSLSFSSLQAQWPSFLDEVKRRNASLVLSLLNSVPEPSDNGNIVVSVRQSFHKERLEKPESRLTIEDALATIFGVKTHLAVKLAPQESVSNDALVESALGILGGKIVS